jgi:hypothetical protein
VIGYLVVRSEFAPRWLGIWLVLGGLSEVALFLWLLVRAVRR